MIDVDARGRHEAELLREQAARIADTEAALQSVLNGDVLVPLVTRGERVPRSVVTRDRVSVRRRVPVLVGVAVAAAAVAAIAFLPSNDTKVITPTDATVTSSTELVVRPLDPPIECELELCPSLAVSPDGTLVGYDQAAKTLTWYDAEPNVVPVTADLDAEQVQLVAIGPNDNAYLVAGSPDTQSWELVRIRARPAGTESNRTASSSPDVDPTASGLRERSCWSGCEPAPRLLMGWGGDGTSGGTAPYPDVSYTTGTVKVVFGELRWTIAWPHTLSTRSQVGQRWDGGAVLSLVSGSADAPSELIELLPDGSVQRFSLGDQPVHALLPDGSAVVWRDGQLVRLSPPQPPPEWPGTLAPDLTAQTFEPPIACNRAPFPSCPELAVSPNGTLVAWDTRADRPNTLTWYEDEPRVVSVETELPPGVDDDLHLIAIGPHDIAYIRSLSLRGPTYLMAVAPSGTEITRVDWPLNGSSTRAGGPLWPTAAGLVGGLPSSSLDFPRPNAALVMPWVDLEGNPITDNRPYPTAKDTDAGIEVRLGERGWLLAGETLPPWSGLLLPRSDGGVVMVLDWANEGATEPNRLLELLPDGTIKQYVFGDTLLARFVGLSSTVLPDGSLVVEHNLQLVRLTPPA